MKSDEPTPAAKQIARYAADILGGRPPIYDYWDEPEENSIGLMVAEDTPEEHLVSYSTVGLADHNVYKGDTPVDFRLEFCGVCDETFDFFDNVIATAAFFVINSRWYCEPGMIFPDMVSMYDSSITMEHLLFLPPFSWPALTELEVEGRSVRWLQLVPISETERKFAITQGWDALDDLLADREIDMTDLDRQPEV